MVHFIGCLVVETLPGSIIELFDHQCNLFFRDLPEIAPFGEIEAKETVGVLIGIPLPGGIGTRGRTEEG
jgi:hypothetical protein